MISEVDKTLQEKGQHIRDATARPALVTGREGVQAALEEGGGLLVEALRVHEEAVQAIEADRIENVTTFQRFDAARAAAVEEVIWSRGKIEDHLLNLRPAALSALPDAEVTRRKGVIALLFPTPPHELRPLRASGFRAAMVSLTQNLDRASMEDVPEAVRAAARESAAKVEVAYKAMVEEQLDDGPLYKAMEGARKRLSDLTSAQRDQVKVALKFDASDLDFEAFVVRLIQRAKATPDPATPDPVKVDAP